MSDFPEKVKIKCLLWSYRHCCLCGKECGTDIEIAHIEQNTDNSQDNAIPLCYQCHAEIGKYNKEHPKGNKYRPRELKTRREQIYEKYTMPLVPPVDYQLGAPRTREIYYHEKDPKKPRTGFTITNLGNSYPIKVRIEITTYIGDKKIGPIKTPIRPYYSGGLLWNLNPQHTMFGNFALKKEWLESSIQPILEVNITLIDIYERQHKLYPMCYRLAGLEERRFWNTEPTAYSELKKFMNQAR